jgi:hypothetical protein
MTRPNDDGNNSTRDRNAYDLLVVPATTAVLLAAGFGLLFAVMARLLAPALTASQELYPIAWSQIGAPFSLFALAAGVFGWELAAALWNRHGRRLTTGLLGLGALLLGSAGGMGAATLIGALGPSLAIPITGLCLLTSLVVAAFCWKMGG